MIGELLAVLNPEQRRTLKTSLAWMVLDAVLQGLAVSMLVPILRAVLEGDERRAAQWLLVAAVLAALAMAAHYVQAMRGFGLAVLILTTLRERLGERIVRLPLGWFDVTSAGRLASVGSTGVMTVCQSIAHLLQPLVSGIATPAVVCVFMLVYDWRLGLVAVAAAPVLWGCARISARALERSETIAHTATVEANAAVLEFAQCQPILRAFGRTATRYAPLEAAIASQHRAGRRQLWATIPGMALTGLTLQATYSAVIVLGIWLVIDDDGDAIAIVAILALLARFVGPLAMVSELSGGMRMARSNLRRIREVLDAAPLEEPVEPAPVTDPGRVEFDHVGFGYGDTPVLRDVSFVARPGTITAIVGVSGAGKSTITRLVPRFWDIDAGAVKVGGVDVRRQRSGDVMAQLALVFQDVYLFDDTLRANISVGRPGASETELNEAARLAGVDEIVARLPLGWDTRVGEGGSRLSGGERQRISIARALLKTASIVLLDEATAALDPTNEYLVRESVAALGERATVLVVAHTPAMIMLADQVLFLDGGTIVERGAPGQLLASGGPFASLFREREHAAGWQINTAGGPA